LDHIFNGWAFISKFMVWLENNAFFCPQGWIKVTFYWNIGWNLKLTQWMLCSTFNCASHLLWLSADPSWLGIDESNRRRDFKSFWYFHRLIVVPYGFKNSQRSHYISFYFCTFFVDS